MKSQAKQLTYELVLLLITFLRLVIYAAQDDPSRDGRAHCQLVSPTSVVLRENAPIDLPVGQSHRAIFSPEISSTQMALGCVYVDQYRICAFSS